MKAIINNPRKWGKSFLTEVARNAARKSYVVLEDHWEYPNHKRVDVSREIALWIVAQEESQWQPSVETASYYRFIITPELLTLLQLQF